MAKNELTGGEGAGLREALKRATKELEEIVSFTRTERSCLRSQEISSIERVVSSSRAALAPQTGSAGEDPKTPDAETREQIADRFMVALPDLTREDALCAAENAYPECLRVLQPAPVGEDETGVREAAIPKPGPMPAYFFQNEPVSSVLAAIAPQTPKAETPAGVHSGLIQRLRLFGNSQRSATGQHTAYSQVMLDAAAALSATPAARPGDGVERVAEVLRERLDQWGYSTGSCSRAQLAHDIIAELAAAPAADGGRA